MHPRTGPAPASRGAAWHENLPRSGSATGPGPPWRPPRVPSTRSLVAGLLVRRLAPLSAVILGIRLIGSLCVSSSSATNTVLSPLPTVTKWHLRVVGHGLTRHPSESLNRVRSLCACAARPRTCTRGPAPGTGAGPDSAPCAAPPQARSATRVSSELPLTCGCSSFSSGSASLAEGGSLGT